MEKQPGEDRDRVEVALGAGSQHRGEHGLHVGGEGGVRMIRRDQAASAEQMRAMPMSA